tara:strand:- start:538 stop:1224 length:687 start_codon:yes stop_codon:yes gene_type:complete
MESAPGAFMVKVSDGDLDRIFKHTEKCQQKIMKLFTSMICVKSAKRTSHDESTRLFYKLFSNMSNEDQVGIANSIVDTIQTMHYLYLTFGHLALMDHFKHSQGEVLQRIYVWFWYNNRTRVSLLLAYYETIVECNRKTKFDETFDMEEAGPYHYVKRVLLQLENVFATIDMHNHKKKNDADLIPHVGVDELGILSSSEGGMEFNFDELGSISIFSQDSNSSTGVVPGT